MLFITVYPEGLLVHHYRQWERTWPLNTVTAKVQKGQNVRNDLVHCPHCPYSSKDKTWLRRHIRTRTGEKPYCCQCCDVFGRCFAQSSACYSHMYNKHYATRAATDQTTKVSKNKRLKHRIVGQKPYSCENVNGALLQCELCKHMRKMHSATDEEIAHLKTKSYTSAHTLQQLIIHNHVYHTEKPSPPCMECGRCNLTSHSVHHICSIMCSCCHKRLSNFLSFVISGTCTLHLVIQQGHSVPVLISRARQKLSITL